MSTRRLLFVVSVGPAVIDVWRWGVLRESPIESRLGLISCPFEESIEYISLAVDTSVISLISDAILFLYTRER